MMDKPTWTAFQRMARAACKAARLGAGFKKEYTLWPARVEWADPKTPSDSAVNAGADMLGFTMREVYDRWDGRQVVEVYVSARSGPVSWGEWELCDNVEIDPVAMEWTSTSRTEWYRIIPGL